MSLKQHGNIIAMPDAWSLLVDSSTVSDVDAWTHLNNQGGGSGRVFAIDTGLTMAEQTETITITDTDNITLSANDDTVTLTAITSSEYLTAQDSSQDLTTNG